MKKFLTLLLMAVTILTVELKAQNVFYGLSLIGGQAYSMPRIFEGTPTNTTQPSQSYLMFGAGIPIDAQVIPLADEMSIGFHAEPSFGYSVTTPTGFTTNLFIVQAPLVAQFNYGNFSSGDATSDFGFGAGFGLLTQFQAGDANNFALVQEGSLLMFMPTAQISCRFWGPSNSLYAVKLSHAFGSEDFGGISNNRSTTFLSFSRYLNY